MEPGTIVRPELQNWNERTVDPQNLAAILGSWKLSIGGLVQKPVELGFCELREMGLITQVTDFHCVEGWSVYDVPWNGIPLSKLLEMVQPKSSATFLEMHCVGAKYLESLAMSVAKEPRSILGLGIDGSTLPLKHGFPARIVVPRLLGYKNAKFVERIELVDYQPSGFWEGYGYPDHGEVPSSRLRPGKY